MTIPITGITPVYGMEYLVEGEPLFHTRAKLERNAKTTEAALVRGGVAPPAAQDLAALAGRVTLLETLPMCVARATATQSIAAGAFVRLNFQTTDVNDGMFSVAAPDRITVTKKGLYQLNGVAAHGGSIPSTVRVGAQLQKNGAAIAMGTKNTAGAAGNASSPVDVPSLIVTLNVGDWVSLAGVQSTAAAVSTVVFADTASYLSVQCLRLLP